MSCVIELNTSNSISIPAALEDVFEFLADVPRAAALFPDVESLTQIGSSTFLWKMNKVGLQSYALQTIYACQYRIDRDQQSISWCPVQNTGNAEQTGRWSLRGEGRATHCTLHLNMVLRFPLPAFMRRAVMPVARHESGRLTALYLERLADEIPRAASARIPQPES